METEIIITLVGLVVAGIAAILGMWIERDKAKPPRYAYALSILILLATVVSMFQTYMDAKQGEKLEGDMARILQMMDKIASSSEVPIPELDDFVKSEIAAQSRANPEVVAKLVQRVADEGNDPSAMLSRNLPPSEVEGLQRRGQLSVKPATVRPTIAVTPRGDGAGDAKPMSLLQKRDAPADAPSAAADAPSAEPEAPSPNALLGKDSGDPKKPSLGVGKPDVKDAPAGGLKVPAAKTDAPKLAPKPKL